ncbi:hypothetical protein GCM10011325_05850 [Dyadobacter sediminis]|nr:hypothetical protein GCM10011325_05850 [Dyadobacter sediminis]
MAGLVKFNRFTVFNSDIRLFSKFCVIFEFFLTSSDARIFELEHSLQKSARVLQMQIFSLKSYLNAKRITMQLSFFNEGR